MKVRFGSRLFSLSVVCAALTAIGSVGSLSSYAAENGAAEKKPVEEKNDDASTKEADSKAGSEKDASEKDASEKDDEADREQYVINVVVTERGDDGKVYVIASPKIVTTADQFAQLSVLDPVPEDKVIIRGARLEDPLEAGMIVRLNVQDLGHEQVRVDVTFDMRRLVVNDEKTPMLAGTSARSILAQRLGKATKMVALADEKGLAQRWIELTVTRAEKK